MSTTISIKHGTETTGRSNPAGTRRNIDIEETYNLRHNVK